MELEQGLLSREENILRFTFENINVQKRIISHLDDKLFHEPENTKMVRHITKFVEKYAHFPHPQELFRSIPDGDSSKIHLIKLMKSDISQIKTEQVFDMVQAFVRERKVFNLLMDSGRNYSEMKIDEIGPLAKELGQCVAFTLNVSIGLNAQEDVQEVLDRLNTTQVAIPSASPTIRALTGNPVSGGGFMRKALSVYMGMPNIGKTIFLCNDAAFAFTCGYNVLYVTLELSEEMILQRIYANVSGIKHEEISQQKASDISALLLEKRHPNALKHGNLYVRELPASTTTPADIENLLDELKLSKGIDFDLLIVDYLGILNPSPTKGVKNSNQNSYTMGKAVAEQLRDIGKTRGLAVLSASQLNRDGYESTQATMKNTADSAGVNNTSDLMITITQEPILRQNALFMHTILKNRFGPKDRTFYTKCDYEHMKIEDATSEQLTIYNNDLASQSAGVSGFSKEEKQKDQPSRGNDSITLKTATVKDPPKLKEPLNKHDNLPPQKWDIIEAERELLATTPSVLPPMQVGATTLSLTDPPKSPFTIPVRTMDTQKQELVYPQGESSKIIFPGQAEEVKAPLTRATVDAQILLPQDKGIFNHGISN